MSVTVINIYSRISISNVLSFIDGNSISGIKMKIATCRSKGDITFHVSVNSVVFITIRKYVRI